MKSLLSVALFLMMMMMMLMVSVSAGPLPPSLNQTRHDNQDTESFHLPQNKEENSTRFESRQNTNMSLYGDVTSNGSWSNARPLPPVVIRTALHGCFLPTCLTVNLGSSLQVGDETAGSATSDAFGIGKK